MLSYRHAFHAGNHADVLKHLILILLARYLGQKDKPYWIIDTHAGAGAYDLEVRTHVKLAEFESGVGRLWAKQGLPEALTAYVEEVRRFKPGRSSEKISGIAPVRSVVNARAGSLRLSNCTRTARVCASYFSGCRQERHR